MTIGAHPKNREEVPSHLSPSSFSFLFAHSTPFRVHAVVTLVTEEDWEQHRKVPFFPAEPPSLSGELTIPRPQDDPLGSHHVWGLLLQTRTGSACLSLLKQAPDASCTPPQAECTTSRTNSQKRCGPTSTTEKRTATRSEP